MPTPAVGLQLRTPSGKGASQSGSADCIQGDDMRSKWPSEVLAWCWQREFIRDTAESDLSSTLLRVCFGARGEIARYYAWVDVEGIFVEMKAEHERRVCS